MTLKDYLTQQCTEDRPWLIFYPTLLDHLMTGAVKVGINGLDYSVAALYEDGQIEQVKINPDDGWLFQEVTDCGVDFVKSPNLNFQKIVSNIQSKRPIVCIPSDESSIILK